MGIITGYRDLSPAEIKTVNAIKQAEVSLGEVWRNVTSGNIAETVQHDPRWAAIAKTHFQEGFSALVRSITRPDDVY